MAATLIRRCAWCDDALPESERPTGENVTHGICPAHSAALMAEVLARRQRKEAAAAGGAAKGDVGADAH